MAYIAVTCCLPPCSWESAYVNIRGRRPPASIPASLAGKLTGHLRDAHPDLPDDVKARKLAEYQRRGQLYRSM